MTISLMFVNNKTFHENCETRSDVASRLSDKWMSAVIQGDTYDCSIIKRFHWNTNNIYWLQNIGCFEATPNIYCYLFNYI